MQNGTLSQYLQTENTIREVVELGDREIIVTDSRLLIIQKNGSRKPSVSDQLKNIEGFESVSKYYKNYIYYLLCSFFTGILCAGFAYGVITTESLQPAIELLSNLPGPMTMAVVFLLQSVVAGISILAILLIIASLSAFIGTVYCGKIYIESNRPYLVIHRNIGPKYEIPAPSVQSATEASVKLEDVYARINS